MTQIDLEHLVDDLAAAGAARPRNAAAYAAALERALAALDAEPAATELFERAELLDELASEYETLGRIEDALAAADAAVAAGSRSAPDPRCRRAEILMRAGRVAEAEPIWAAVRVDTPDDVWLYNNAGLEYAAAGDDETSLRWLTDGLRLALDSGDPERLVDQLADLRRASLEALQQAEDDLQKEAAAFLDAERQAKAARRAAVATPTLGASPPPRPIPGTLPPRSGQPTQARAEIAWAWLPADEYEKAVQAWPDMAEGVIDAPTGRITHAEYCRELQRRLSDAADSGLIRNKIAPLRVDAFSAWCAANDREPGSDVRAAYAADMARLRDPSLISWPPKRNEPCWCGSGRKYKKCCAAPGAAR
jgi:tetratricopeptide (TPR) repeat protein